MLKLRILQAAIAAFIVSTVPQAIAQNSIQLFGPVNVRPSASTTSTDNPVNFNSNTLNLSCSASPITAVLSSSADGSGNVLVDNNINVTVTSGGNTVGPTNVCKGGVPNSPFESCFTTNYQGPASQGQLNGVDPDTLLPGGGVGPIDISSLLMAGSQQVKIDLEDEGGYLASSTLYLNTNCTSGGVSAPATISGNTITSTNPTTLNQTFTFNPLANNAINFQYDLSTAQNAGTLTIDPNGPIPSAGDMSLDPSTWQSTWATGTSFATSSCFIHNGEKLASRLAGCKLYTLTCTIGTGSDAKGINCPVSTNPNEAINDIFDGPAITLGDHQGVGFLMASEPWSGGACQFATGSGFENSTCPQNILATFSGPGIFNSNGITTHPNSTFITIWGVPEDVTTVTPVPTLKYGWFNTSTPTVAFSSQPPSVPSPNTNIFVPSPIQSITYGISPADSVPPPGAPVAGDTTLINGTECPLPSTPTNPPASTFTPPQQALGPLEDGQYALHYFAQDCAGSKELKFTNSGGPNGTWSTNFYTVPINVDTVPPAVASGPTLSPAGPYFQGQPGVTATFSCTDSLSGVVMCGGKSFPAGTLTTGNVTVPVSTSTPGSNTFTAVAVDAAGNQSSPASVPYTVTAADSQVQVTLASGTVTYPLGTNLEVLVSKIGSHVPTGTVRIVDNGTTTLTTLSLNNAGDAFFYVKNLSAGMHSLTAVYSGDKFNPGGTSAPATLNVLPVPVTLSVACWNTAFRVGANFQCNVHATSTAGAAPGSITYVYDGNPPASAALSSGAALIVITKPPVGNHSIVISYPGQPNFAPAGPQTVNFTVTP